MVNVTVLTSVSVLDVWMVVGLLNVIVWVLKYTVVVVIVKRFGVLVVVKVSEGMVMVSSVVWNAVLVDVQICAKDKTAWVAVRVPDANWTLVDINDVVAETVLLIVSVDW
jgi:hypothetical protein